MRVERPTSPSSLPTTEQNAKRPQAPAPSSSLSSLANNPIISFFTWIWNLLFSCLRPTPIKAVPIPKPPQPPKTLTEQAPEPCPFELLLFIDETETRSYKSPEAVHLYARLFAHLGTGDPWHWWKNKTEIDQIEARLIKLDLHPLATLYFLFLNELRIREVQKFREGGDKLLSYTTLKMIMKVTNRGHPWDEELVTKIANKLALYEEKITPHIPGFCRYLSLPKEQVEILVKNRLWQDLIQYIYTQRVSSIL